MQARPPELQTKLWDKETDGPEIALWCGGRMVNSKTMQIPDVVDQDDGFTAAFPCYIVKIERRFLPMDIAELQLNYTTKLV
jgi:hypothetical protein